MTASHSAMARDSAASSSRAVSSVATAPPVGAPEAMSAPSVSRIVTTAVPSAIVAPTGDESTTVKVSVGSEVRLLTMLTVKLAVVAPAAKVTVAVFAWKSLPASAVPAAVVAVTVTAVAAGADSRTVTVTVVVFTLPSVTVRSSIVSCGRSLSAIEAVPAAGEPTV